MSKNQKTSKTNDTATSANKQVGRPKYQPVFPRTSKWTFLDFAKANGVDTETLDKNGNRIMKGTKCTVLTLRHWLDRDIYQVTAKNKPDRTNLRRNSLVVLTDELGESTPFADGLGRRPFLFQLRAKQTAKVAVTKTPKTAKGVSKGTQDYEARKSELLAPTPAVTITPAVTVTAPVVETPAVAETSPVASEPASDTAPVAETSPVTSEPVAA